MITQQMHYQYPLDLDLDLLAIEQLTQAATTHVLAVIELAIAVEQQPQYGVFLPKRMRDEISRNNGRISQGRSI